MKGNEARQLVALTRDREAVRFGPSKPGGCNDQNPGATGQD